MTEEKKKMPAWARHLIGWPIVVGVLTVAGWFATGKWWMGIFTVVAVFGAFAGILGILFFFWLILWIFGMEDDGNGCSY